MYLYCVGNQNATCRGAQLQNKTKLGKSFQSVSVSVILYLQNNYVLVNSVQTRCIVKARLRKVHFSGDFPRVFDFLRIACSLGITQEKPLNLIKSPIFTNAPCKSSFLYNAPSMHTVGV